MSKLQMKKLVVAVAALGAVAMGSGVAQAANTSGSFNVNITLTSSCQLGTVGAVNFAYTSLQGGASSATGGAFNVTCSNTLPYSLGLSAGTPGTAPGAATLAVTDNGVNLAYSLGLSATSNVGNGNAQSFNVTGSMASGQAGTCAAAGGGTCSNTAGATTSTNNVQTLFVTY